MSDNKSIEEINTDLDKIVIILENNHKTLQELANAVQAITLSIDFINTRLDRLERVNTPKVVK